MLWLILAVLAILFLALAITAQDGAPIILLWVGLFMVAGFGAIIQLTGIYPRPLHPELPVVSQCPVVWTFKE
jgi:hypothetical protein